MLVISNRKQETIIETQESKAETWKQAGHMKLRALRLEIPAMPSPQPHSRKPFCTNAYCKIKIGVQLTMNITTYTLEGWALLNPH